MKIAYLLILLFLCTLVKAQTTIRANDPGIRYDLIEPGHFTLKGAVFDNSGNKMQDFTSDSYITVDKSSKQIALIRRFFDQTTHILSLDTSFIGGLPVRMHSVEQPAHKELQIKFNPTSINVKSLIDGEAKDEVYAMKEGYFDDNILVDIMGYFPIKQGIKYSMEGFRFESVKTKGVSAYEVEYLHDDFLTGANDKQALCKVIYYKNDYCYGYAWYEKSTGKPLKLLVYIKKIIYLLNFE